MTNDKKNTEFIDHLNEIISESKATKKAFAENCGVSETQLHKYLRGRAEPGMHFFIAMKNQYPWVNIDWLITGQGDPTTDAESGRIIPIDPAVGLVIEVENELGIKLNDQQRQAVVSVLRREIDHRLGEQRAGITNLISSFIKGGQNE